MTTNHQKKKRAVPPEVEPSKPKPKPTVAPKPTTKPPVVPPPVVVPPVKPPVTTTTTPPAPPPETTTTESVLPTTTIDPGSSTGTEPTSSSGPNTGLIVGIVAGVAVLLALIAGLVVRNRRKRQRGEEVYKAELYQQQRMMTDNSSSVLANGRVPRRFGGASATGTGSRGGVSLGLGKRGISGERGDRESLSEDYHQQQEAYYQQQPEWFAKKSPLEYYRQVPPIEELLRSVGRKESDNSLGDGCNVMTGPGDKDEIIELQHTGPLSSSSSSAAAPGQGVTEIIAARSLQASTMQQNLQQHQQEQLLQQQRQQQLQLQKQQLQQQQRQQQQEQELQQYTRDSIPLNPTQHIDTSTSTANHSYPIRPNNNEEGMVFPPRHQQLSQQLQQEREKQLQQQQQREDQQNTREDYTPPHSGHLPPIQPHSPMSSVYHEIQRSPTATATTTSHTSGVFLHAPMAISRPNSFYNASNILNAAGENSIAEKGEDYTDIDMSAYYRPPPPPVIPVAPSGFYDFDLDAPDSGNSNNNNNNNNNRSVPAVASFANGISSPTSTGPGAGMGRPMAGVVSPPPIPRATRPASVVPPRSNSNNSANNNGAPPPIPVSPYTPPPVPTISTTNGVPSYSTGAGAGVTSPTPLSPISPTSPTSPSNGPLMGGRTPRSIHGSVGRRV
ncbi:hypothetical protein BGW39_007996 [Mortierella sp. 14UC]|nr:hypothetical protein BGW39_007996 [Mortierella sp. 14UC]